MIREDPSRLAPAPLELRVLSGPQAGSRLVVTDGQYLIGLGDACDIILHGASVALEHARLTISAGAWRIQPLQDTLWTADGNTHVDEFAVSLAGLINLGGVWICVDRQDADWPEAPEVLATVSASLADTASDLPIPVTFPGAPPGVIGRAPLLARVNAVSWPRKFMTVLAIGLIASCGAAIWWQHLTADANDLPAMAEAVREDPAAALQATLALAGAGKQVSVVRHRDGRLLLKGHVPDEAARNAIVAAARQRNPDVQSHLYVDATVLAEARRIVTALAPPEANLLRLESLGEGEFRLTGASSNPERVEIIADALRTDAPGLARLEVTVAGPDQLRERLKARLADARLDARLTLTQDKGGVLLAGTLNAEEMRQWIALFADFTREYGTVLSIRAAVTRLGSALPFAIQSISGGPGGFVVTTTGVRIPEGGTFAGVRLVAIKDTELIFEGPDRIHMTR